MSQCFQTERSPICALRLHERKARSTRPLGRSTGRNCTEVARRSFRSARWTLRDSKESLKHAPEFKYSDEQKRVIVEALAVDLHHLTSAALK